MEVELILKRVGKDIEIVKTDKKYITDAVKDFLGKDLKFEKVKIDNDFYMYVDEIGAIKELPVNFLIETTSPYFPIQKIYGDVIFARHKNNYLFEEIWDYEVDNVTEEDIEIVKDMLYISQI